MSEIVTPDEDGGIDIGEAVSFVVMPARSGKGIQACDVKFAEPPKKEGENVKPMGGLSIADGNGETDWGAGGWGAPASSTDAAANDSGDANRGTANGAGDTPAGDPAIMDWGAWGQ